MLTDDSTDSTIGDSEQAAAQSLFTIRATENQKTLYQTLMSVSSVVDDQSKFEASDFEAAKKRYSSVFINNSVSEDIFDAIAAKSGSIAATRSKVSNNV
jgi:hypothetical protein